MMRAAVQYSVWRLQFNRIQEILLSQEQCLALLSELQELLLKKAFSRVPQGEENQGFLLPLFSGPERGE